MSTRRLHHRCRIRILFPKTPATRKRLSAMSRIYSQCIVASLHERSRSHLSSSTRCAHAIQGDGALAGDVLSSFAAAAALARVLAPEILEGTAADARGPNAAGARVPDFARGLAALGLVLRGVGRSRVLPIVHYGDGCRSKRTVQSGRATSRWLRRTLGAEIPLGTIFTDRCSLFPLKLSSFTGCANALTGTSLVGSRSAGLREVLVTSEATKRSEYCAFSPAC